MAVLPRVTARSALLLPLVLVAAPAAAQTEDCDKACLESLADSYREAYVAHDPQRLPIADSVRYTENNVEMPFPDGTWDTVTEEVGPPLTLSDPQTGNVGIYTPIKQREVEGYLAVRLKVEGGEITEIEHIVSTRRNLSSPPTPIDDHDQYELDPVIDQVEPEGQRASREELEAHAAGYFSTLQQNDGEIRGTCFHPDAIRRENGMLFDEIEQGFKLGYYAFNDRVRHWPVLVDEERGVVMARAFIDHKGVLDEYTLTDGTERESVFQQPQSWGLLEMFKVREGCIDSVMATFVQAPYYMESPWVDEERPARHD